MNPEGVVLFLSHYPTTPRSPPPPQIPKECHQVGASHLFVVFWLLELSDLQHPDEAYKATIAACQNAIAQNRTEASDIEQRLEQARGMPQ